MTSSIAVDSNVVTLINILTVEPEKQPELLTLLEHNADTTIRTLNGWISTNLIASQDKRRVIIYSQWRSLADVAAMRTDKRMMEYFPRLTALASFESVVGDVAAVFHV